MCGTITSEQLLSVIKKYRWKQVCISIICTCSLLYMSEMNPVKTHLGVSVELNSCLGVAWMQRKPVLLAMRQNKVCFCWDQKKEEKERSPARLTAAREKSAAFTKSRKQPSYHLQPQYCHLTSTRSITLTLHTHTHTSHCTAFRGEKNTHLFSAWMGNHCLSCTGRFRSHTHATRYMLQAWR